MNWNEIIETLGGTAILVAAGAWVLRSLFGHLFSKDLEQFKQNITAKHDQELEKIRHSYAQELQHLKGKTEKELEHYRSVMQLETSTEERIRSEILRWANPILGAVQDLESRLNNILDRKGYIALSEEYEQKVNPNWSISYSYFMSSTLYLFSSYFCWVRMLQEHLSFELFRTQQEKDDFFGAIQTVNRALGSFPPRYSCKGTDLQVFNLQQRAIGEMLMRKTSEGPRCMSYNEFLEKLDKPPLTDRLEPLRALLERLHPDEDCRWKRLETTRDALGGLQKYCEGLLNVT